MSSFGATESDSPTSGSGGCGGRGAATSSFTDIPMKDEAIDSSPFEEAEQVLAYHGPCIYDAKVQKKVEYCDGGWRYYVHYREESIIQLENIVNIQIPYTLKKQLVDDHECITHLGQLVKLPRSPNVYAILNKYIDYRVKKDGMIVEAVQEVVNGLRCYFDKALPAMLLYQRERQQYKDMIVEDVSPSSIYGAEHLLRLFVKLPEMLSCLYIETETLTELQQRLLDFLRFLQSNQSAFFYTDYQKSEGFIDGVKNEYA